MATPYAEVLGRAPRLTIKVTSEIIKRSEKRNSNHCVFAEGIKVAYPHLNYIAVDLQTMRATNPAKHERYTWLTPRVAQIAIIDFDRGKEQQPFTFVLDNGHTTRSGTTRPKKVSLRQPRHANAQSALQPVGGSPPPHSVGQRRQFGLRRLKY